MLYSEYLKTLHIGDKIDYDGHFGPQCVDLARAYCEAIGAPQLPKVVGAGDFVEEYAKGNIHGFIRVDRPVPGCLAIHRRGEYGHVAIVCGVTANNVVVLEQNGYTQAGIQESIKKSSDFEMYLLPEVNLR